MSLEEAPAFVLDGPSQGHDVFVSPDERVPVRELVEQGFTLAHRWQRFVNFRLAGVPLRIDPELDWEELPRLQDDVEALIRVAEVMST